MLTNSQSAPLPFSAYVSAFFPVQTCPDYIVLVWDNTRPSETILLTVWCLKALLTAPPQSSKTHLELAIHRPAKHCAIQYRNSARTSLSLTITDYLSFCLRKATTVLYLTQKEQKVIRKTWKSVVVPVLPLLLSGSKDPIVIYRVFGGHLLDKQNAISDGHIHGLFHRHGVWHTYPISDGHIHGLFHRHGVWQTYPISDGHIHGLFHRHSVWHTYTISDGHIHGPVSYTHLTLPTKLSV